MARTFCGDDELSGKKRLLITGTKTAYLFYPIRYILMIDYMLQHPSLSLLDLTVSYELFVESQNFTKKAAAAKEILPVAYVVIW